MVGIRIFIHLLPFTGFSVGIKENKRYVIVGEQKETLRVADLLRKTDMKPGFIGFVGTKREHIKVEGFIGTIEQIKDIINIYQIDELIFCAKDIAADRIIDNMSALGGLAVNFKIAPPESLSIIGSQSINTTGDAYIVELNSIQKVNNKRNKRFLDIIMSLVFLVTLPLLVWFVKKPFGYFGNILQVLSGQKSWVGYQSELHTTTISLPNLKKGILFPSDAISSKIIDHETVLRIDTLYARDYKIINDLNIILKGFRNLGRRKA